MSAPLYRSDFYAWTQEQSDKLRRMFADRSDSELDIENIAEEIDSLGRSNRREVHSRLARIIEHFLKLGESTLWEPRNQWRNSVIAERESLKEVFEESQSLFAARAEELLGAFATAKRRLDRHVIELCMNPVPRVCPYELDSQILSDDWFPTPRYPI